MLDVYVVAQMILWLEFCFPLSQIMIMNLRQRKTKIKLV